MNFLFVFLLFLSCFIALVHSGPLPEADPGVIIIAGGRNRGYNNRRRWRQFKKQSRRNRNNYSRNDYYDTGYGRPLIGFGVFGKKK